MKIFGKVIFCLALSAAGTHAQTAANTTASAPAATTPQITSLGANYNLWQWQTSVDLGNGRSVVQNHSYTEIASGLNYQDPASGKWLPARAVIQPHPQGAVASQGQHQIIFADNLNTAGAIDEQTPDGKRLISNIIGLLYYDPATGQSAQIAQVQDSEGQLIADNQVLFTNAFNGVNADVLLTYRLDGMEQDVVLRAQLPAPESFGLNPATVELEAVTAFLNPPAATVWNVGTDSQGLEADQAISWGATSLGHGKAFSLDGQDVSANVIKQYVQVDGQYYLLEKVRFQDIQQALSSLPEQASNARSLPRIASKHLQLPKIPVGKQAARPMRMAAATHHQKGYVLDYISLNSAYTNYVFQGGITYYLSSSLNLSGTNTFEPNTIIKYAANASITGVSGSAMVFGSKSFRPIVFTAKDDNTIGENLPMSTGSPSGYYANPALSLASGGNVTLAEFRMAYANRGLSVNGISPTIYDAQFVNSAMAVSDVNGSVSLGNVLFSNVKTNFNVTSSANSITVENGTFNNEFDLVNGSDSNTAFYLTNCAFVNMTNLSGTIAAAYNGFFQAPTVGSSAVTSTAYPFQRIGAASCYLTNGCVFLGAGTPNIDPNTLGCIEIGTTYPPVVFTGYTFSTVTNLSPQAQRDTSSSPSLGYHYDSLDYAFGNTLAKSNLTFTAGATAAWFYTGSGATYGLEVGDSATVNFSGTATAPCYWVRYNLVQEGYDGNWTPESYLAGMVGQSYTHAAPAASAQFTIFSTPPTEAGPFRDNASDNLFVFTGHDCEFYTGAGGGYNLSITYTNCLLMNGGPTIYDNYGSASLTMENCTCFRGTVEGDNTSGGAWPVTIQNCAFDSTTFYLNAHGGTTNGYYTDYNSFLAYSNTTPYLGSHSITNITAYNWETSWFGNYYLPTNSLLIQAGSTTADQLGLYHFTTQTNQIPETNSIVDIGYHFVATDAYGNPLDSNGDGIPDYLEDVNGNGLVDPGEVPWIPFNDWWQSTGIHIFRPNISGMTVTTPSGH